MVRRRTTEWLKRQARRLHGERRSLVEVLNNERRNKRGDQAELIERCLAGQALDAKPRD